MTLLNAKTNAKSLLSLFVFVVATSTTSVQATELVKVEKLNKVEFSMNTEMNLSESIQLMNVNFNSVQNTAKTMLSNQASKFDNKAANTLAKVSLLSE